MALSCTNCATPLENDMKFCPSCGAMVYSSSPPQASPVLASATPAPATSAKATPQPAVSPRRYPALRIIAVIFKVQAVLVVVGALFSAFEVESIPGAYGATFGGPAVASLGPAVAFLGPAVTFFASVVAFLIVLSGLGWGLFLWALAEMIHVGIDIEENTRRAAAR